LDDLKRCTRWTPRTREAERSLACFPPVVVQLPMTLLADCGEVVVVGDVAEVVADSRGPQSAAFADWVRSESACSSSSPLPTVPS
jgi:hypothetical protein